MESRVSPGSQIKEMGGIPLLTGGGASGWAQQDARCARSTGSILSAASTKPNSPDSKSKNALKRVHLDSRTLRVTLTWQVDLSAGRWWLHGGGGAPRSR